MYCADKSPDTMRRLIVFLLFLTSFARADVSPIWLVTYLTDLEGSRTRLKSFFQQSEAFQKGKDGRYHLRDGAVFVFGGDAFDRFVGDLEVAEELVRLKTEAPDRVFFILGNRDINKLRFWPETSPEALKRPPLWFALTKEGIWKPDSVHTKTERIKFILDNTMGAPQAFELRRQELADRAATTHSKITDDAVAQSFLDTTKPGGIVHKLLRLGQLALRIENTLIIHGGLTPQNVRKNPDGSGAILKMDEMIRTKNAWLQSEIDKWDKNFEKWDGVGPRPAEDLLDYPMPAIGRNSKPESLVTGRNVDANNNPHLPTPEMIEWSLANDSQRLLLGHTPSGHFPETIQTQDGRYQVGIGDNSYASEDIASVINLRRSSPTSRFDIMEMRGFSEVDPARKYFVSARLKLGQPSPIGMLTPEGDMILGHPDSNPDQFITYRMDPGYKSVQKILSAAEVSKLALREASAPAIKRVNGQVGIISGAFDPPTLADRDLIEKALETYQLKKIYVVVNTQGAREYHASVVERIDMLKMTLAGLEERVEIRGEPFHGREAVLEALQRDRTQPIVKLVIEPVDRHPSAPAPEVTRWINQQGLYRILGPDQRAAAEAEHKALYKEFQDEVRAKLPRLSLKELPAPQWNLFQSKGAWLEHFILWTIQGNSLDQANAIVFADSARFIFANKGWEKRFPIVKLKSGVPSARCLDALGGK